MLSPAALLVLKRLIAILTILIRALEHTIGERRTQNLRQAALRFLLTRLVAHLTELDDSEDEADEAAKPGAPPLPHPPYEPRTPLVTDLTTKPYPTPTPTASDAPLPLHTARLPLPNLPPRSKSHPAIPQMHAQIITSS